MNLKTKAWGADLVQVQYVHNQGGNTHCLLLDLDFPYNLCSMIIKVQKSRL